MEHLGAQPLNSRHLAGGPKHLPSTFRAPFPPSERLPSTFGAPAQFARRCWVDQGENTSEARKQSSYLQNPTRGPGDKGLEPPLCTR